MKNASSPSHTQLTLNIIIVGLLAILFVLVLDLSSRLKAQEHRNEIMLTSMQLMGTTMQQLEAAKK